MTQRKKALIENIEPNLNAIQINADRQARDFGLISHGAHGWGPDRRGSTHSDQTQRLFRKQAAFITR